MNNLSNDGYSLVNIAWLMAIDCKLSVVMNLEPDASSVESSLNFLGDVRTHDCFVALISKFLSYSFSCIWQLLIATVMFSFLNVTMYCDIVFHLYFTYII